MVFLKKRSYTGGCDDIVTSPKIPSPGEKELPQLLRQLLCCSGVPGGARS